MPSPKVPLVIQVSYCISLVVDPIIPTKLTDVCGVCGFTGTSSSSLKTLFTIDNRISDSSSMQSSQSTLGHLVQSIFLAVPFLSSQMAPSVAFCHGEYGSVCLTWQPACHVLHLNSPIVCSFDPSIITWLGRPPGQTIRIMLHALGLLSSLGKPYTRSCNA